VEILPVTTVALLLAVQWFGVSGGSVVKTAITVLSDEHFLVRFI